MLGGRVGKGVLSAVLLLARVLASPGCGHDHGNSGRVLLVGIDGASLRVAEPLLQEGKLPHLAELGL